MSQCGAWPVLYIRFSVLPSAVRSDRRFSAHRCFFQGRVVKRSNRRETPTPPPPPQAVKERAWFGKTWRKQGSKEELGGNRARTAGRTVAAGRQLYGTLFSFFRSIFFFVSKGAATAFYSKLTELAANDLDLEKRKAQGCWYCKRGVGRQKIRLGGSGRVVNNHLVRWRSSVFQTVKSCSLFF